MATTYYGAPIPVLDDAGEGAGGYVADVATAFQVFDTQIHTARLKTDAIAAITNGVIVSTSGTLSGKRYLVQNYTPTANQLIDTTTYTTINGSSAAFTPNSASSTILYKYTFHIQGPRGSLPTAFHMKLYEDTTYIAPRAATFLGEATYEGQYTFTAAVPSWSGTKTFYLKARVYATPYLVWLNSSFYLDGVTAEWYPSSTLEIYEL